MKKMLLLFAFTFVQGLYAQIQDFATHDFEKADAIASTYNGESLKNLPVLALRLTAQCKTDAEKFRAIFYWVTHNIEGDYRLTMTSDQKHEKLLGKPEAYLKWQKKFRQEVFNTLLQHKSTVCTGYAYLLKHLSNLAGVECEIVHGYGKIDHNNIKNMSIPNHSWNAVKLDEKWYLCDATWASGSIDSYSYEFQYKYDNSFFLMEPVEFAETHRPIENKWLLLQDANE